MSCLMGACGVSSWDGVSTVMLYSTDTACQREGKTWSVVSQSGLSLVVVWSCGEDV